jgi:hypothetical protein
VEFRQLPARRLTPGAQARANGEGIVPGPTLRAQVTKGGVGFALIVLLAVLPVSRRAVNRHFKPLLKRAGLPLIAGTISGTHALP